MPAPRRRSLATGPVGIVLTTLAVAGAAIAAPAGDSSTLTPDQQRALDAGFQVASKSGAGARVADTANPYLANLPDLSKADFAGWRARMAAAGDRRAGLATYRQARSQANAVTPAAAAAVVHDEEEPAGTAGSNDSLANAERIPGFGTAAAKNNVLRILGSQAEIAVPAAEDLEPGAEDNGSIPLATPTGIEGPSAVTTTGVLGDGPHGSAGDGTNDFDV